MKKRVLWPVFILMAAGFSLLQQGCRVYIVRGNDTSTPVPFPNAWHIELRVREQVNRIQTAVQNGSLDQDTSFWLIQNDELVRRFSRDDRTPSHQTLDLNYQQMAQLDAMLNDNSRFIDDAIQNHQAWVSYFQGENYDYTSSGDPYLYLSYMDYQAKAQLNRVNQGLKTGHLTAAQAQELRNHIQIEQNLKYSYYSQNGRLDLSEDQVRQLSRMMEDNSRYLRFRLHGSRGRWDRQRFIDLRGENNRGYQQDNGNHWGWRNNQNNQVNTGNGWNQNQNNNWNQNQSNNNLNNSASDRVHPRLTGVPTPITVVRPLAPAPTATPVPITPPVTVVVSAPTPIPTPVPIVRVMPPTATPIPVAPPVTVVSAPTPVPTPKPQPPAPTATPVPVALKLLPPGQLVSFLQHADNAVNKVLGSASDDQASALKQSLANLHSAADNFLKQNQAKSVTADQMAQLVKMEAGIEQIIQQVAAQAQPVSETQSSDDSDSHGNKGKGHGHHDDSGDQDSQGDNGNGQGHGNKPSHDKDQN